MWIDLIYIWFAVMIFTSLILELIRHRMNSKAYKELYKIAMVGWDDAMDGYFDLLNLLRKLTDELNAYRNRK